jgi:RNA polymerase sigma-70 factor (ECF subfamily)
MSPAFAAEVAAQRVYLMRVALGRLRDSTRAEDAVQETLLAALRAGQSFDGRSKLRTWLTGILLHKIYDCFRAGTRDEIFTELTDDAPAAWGDPERSLDSKQSWAAFVAAIEALPPRQARAFILRELEGQATGEICEALGVSAENLWVLLFRARAALKNAMAGSGVSAF